MLRLDDSSIELMQEDDLRRELRELRARYREMHRRAQNSVPEQERTEAARKLQRAQEVAECRYRNWLFATDRLSHAHKVVKEIFELAAAKRNLPYGRYHSVGDLPFGKSLDGKLYANVYLTPKGGIETFDVAEEVRKAIDGNEGYNMRPTSSWLS